MKEARLHTVFGLLFVLSFFGSDQLQKLLPTWYDPKIGLISFVVALLWLTTFFLNLGKALLDEQRVLRDRVERLENKVAALEDERALK
jgi:hypothetical protein